MLRLTKDLRISLRHPRHSCDPGLPLRRIATAKFGRVGSIISLESIDRADIGTDQLRSLDRVGDAADLGIEFRSLMQQVRHGVGVGRNSLPQFIVAQIYALHSEPQRLLIPRAQEYAV